MAAVACGDDGPETRTYTLSADLQQVLGEVAGLRGLPAPENFEAGMLERAAVRDVIESSLSDADQAEFAKLTDVYRALGFIGRDEEYGDLYLDFAASAVIAFYEPGERRLYLVGEGAEVPFQDLDAYLKSIIAHEMVHAVQQREFPGLQQKAAGDLDWTLALSAVVEGDAVFHERRWALEHVQAQPGPVLSASPSSVPAAMERALRFPYESGLDWLAAVESSLGMEAVNEVLRGRGLTTAEILHPALFESGFEPAEVELPDVSAALGDSWERTGGGSFGEFHLRNFLQLQLGGLPAVAAAQGWRGDRYDLYRDGNDLLFVLRVRFTGPVDVAEFATAVSDWRRAAGADASGVLRDGRALSVRTSGGEDALLVLGPPVAVAKANVGLGGAD